MRILAYALLLAAAPVAVAAPPLPSTDANKPRVYAGAFLNDVSAFDLKAGEFKADLVVWVKWRGSEEVPPLEFRNATIETREEVARENDGDWRMVRWHVQGTFRGTFPLHRFPFDRQALRLELGLGDSSRVLVPDLAASGMSPTFSITGWLYEPYFATERATSLIASDLGSVRAEGLPQQVQSIGLVLTLTRPFASYVLKFVLPLLIIVGMALLSFFLPASVLDVRAGMVVTALLSCVAFHFSQADSLPDVSYLVAADKLFLAAYVAILLALVATVASFQISAQSAVRSRNVDRTALATLTLGVGISMVSILGSAYNLPDEREALTDLPRTPKPGPVLRVGISSMKSLGALGLLGLQRRGLSNYNSDGMRVPFALVEYPDMSNSSVRLLPDGGMRVRWRLKRGLHFSDGSALTAKDLAFSMALTAEPDRTALEVVDELTVEATWRNRNPAALVERAVYPAVVLSETERDGGRDAVIQRSTAEVIPYDGPFMIEQVEMGKFARLVQNPWFAGAQPNIGSIEFTVYPSSEALADALQSGNIHFAPTLSVNGLAKLEGDERFRVRVEPAETLWALHPDMNVKVLANPRVRRALLLAIDRRAFAKALFDDEALVTDTYVANIEPDHVAMVPAPFDPATAKQILEEEGVLPLKLPVHFMDAPEGSPQLKANRVVFDSLRAVGVNVVPNPVKTGVYSLIDKGRHGGLVLTARGTTGSPARYFNLPAAGGNIDTTFRAPHFTDDTARLLNDWEMSLFTERKESLSARLQTTFAQVLPVLPLCSGRDQSAYSKQLKGYAPVRRSTWWNVETWQLEDPAAAASP